MSCGATPGGQVSAQSDIEAAELTLSFSPDDPPDASSLNVDDQEPTAGERVDPDTEVTLTISSGADVIGMTGDEATQTLEKTGSRPCSMTATTILRPAQSWIKTSPGRRSPEAYCGSCQLDSSRPYLRVAEDGLQACLGVCAGASLDLPVIRVRVVRS
jgi:hypothetical protein